jgi:hypothetical protein
VRKGRCSGMHGDVSSKLLANGRALVEQPAGPLFDGYSGEGGNGICGVRSVIGSIHTLEDRP